MNKTILLIALVATTFFVVNCSKDDESGLDTQAPVVIIKQPELDKYYLTNLFGNGPEAAIFYGEAKDNREIKTMEISVTDSLGTIVHEKLIDVEPGKKNYELWGWFQTEIKGVYTVIFSSTDASGNVGTSTPRTFTYIYVSDPYPSPSANKRLQCMPEQVDKPNN